MFHLYEICATSDFISIHSPNPGQKIVICWPFPPYHHQRSGKHILLDGLHLLFLHYEMFMDGKMFHGILYQYLIFHNLHYIVCGLYSVNVHIFHMSYVAKSNNICSWYKCYHILIASI